MQRRSGVMHNNLKYMNRKIIVILLAILSFSTIALSADKHFTLVIDAGHGGHDAGARGAYSLEKNINLNVALAFGRYVEENCPDVKVIYTRKKDVFIPLHQRADIANKNKADVFISIHTNALPAGHIARGLETYTMGMRRSDEKLSAAKRENAVITIEKDYKEHYEGYDPNSPESTIMFEFMHDKNMAKSVELAKYVQKNVCATASRPDKGVKQDVFLVLRETSMPACLIELGFITTPDEEAYLNNKDNVDKLGKGIYQAFLAFKKKYSKGFTVPYNAPKETPVNVPALIDNNETKEVAVIPVKTKTPTVKQRNTQITVSTSSNSDSTDSKATVKTAKAAVAAATKQAATAKNSKTVTGKSNQDSTHKPAAKAASHQETNNDKPVFKVQIIASSKLIRAGSPQFKGLGDVSSYRENDYVKYTYGASTNYNEIYRLRKSILDKFPEAFIVAFKNGEKMNINQAIKEFKNNR